MSDIDLGLRESQSNKVAVMDKDGKKVWEGSVTEYGKLLDLLRAANGDIATLERKDIDAATLAWAIIVPYVEIVEVDDFAYALSATSLLNYFFEKILPEALGITDTE